MTHRTFIAAILSAAIALTGLTAAPARADSEDIAKWIAGAAALAIIGSAIANRDDDKRRRAVTRNRAYERDFDYDDYYDDDHDRYHRKHARKHKGLHRNHRFLPARCHVREHSRYGRLNGFDRRCLHRHYSHFNALPHQCAVRPGTRSRVIYSDRCLYRHGYRVSRR